MAVEKEIDLDHSEDFELDFVEKTEDTIENVLDERDYIPPLKEIEEESSSPSEMNDSMETQEQDEEEIDIPSIDKDDQEVNPQSEEETDILLNENDEHLSDQSASAESEWDMQGEIIDPGGRRSEHQRERR